MDERKAAIYENLRDLQFEYRVGKLSDQDYQNTKKDLQKDLAAVLAEVDALRTRLALGIGLVGQAVPPATHSLNGYSCASCGANFEKPLKFCGECGKPMKVAQA
jgi:rRNA maturation endonuclease Nob1